MMLQKRGTLPCFVCLPVVANIYLLQKRRELAFGVLNLACFYHFIIGGKSCKI